MGNCWLRFKYAILEVLGWIGLALVLLTLVTVVGTIIVAAILDWEFGVSLLLVGIIVIPGGIVAGYYFYRLFLFEQKICLGIPNFVKCPYCGMNNEVIDVFCARCGKALPKKRMRARIEYILFF